PDSLGNGLTQAANVEYKSREWNWGIQEQSVGKEYRAEVGYVPRNGYANISSFLGYLFFPKGGIVLDHGPKIASSYFFDQRMNRTDNVNELNYLVQFRDRSEFNASFGNEFVQLLEPFDPTQSGNVPLPIGSQHRWNALTMEYFSKPQSLFTYSASGRYGGYYAHGRRVSILSELGYRFQPHVSLAANVNYNYLDLPEPWNITDFWLVGSKVDVTFTNKVFWATLFQYNEQTGNFNLNSR